MSTLEPTNRWYAFKVFYNKVFVVDEQMRAEGLETYFPVIRSYKLVDGETKMQVKPAISSLIFVRCTEEAVMLWQKRLSGRVMLYSHISEGVRRPSPIDDEEMRVFQLVSAVDDDRLEYLDVGSVNYRTGQKVRVTGGPYKDCVGYIKRIKGNRRLLVSVEGLALVATSYIPSEFLVKV